jgi:hypothetical protein
MRPGFATMLTQSLALSAASCLALACGSAPTSPTSPSATGDEAAHGEQHAAETPGDEPFAPPLTVEECRELIAHVVELAVHEDAAEHPELPPPTAEELAAMHEHLREELEDRCVGRERGVYDCAMGAASRDELAACDDATS